MQESTLSKHPHSVILESKINKLALATLVSGSHRATLVSSFLFIVMLESKISELALATLVSASIINRHASEREHKMPLMAFYAEASMICSSADKRASDV